MKELFARTPYILHRQRVSWNNWLRVAGWGIYFDKDVESQKVEQVVPNYENTESYVARAPMPTFKDPIQQMSHLLEMLDFSLAKNELFLHRDQWYQGNIFRRGEIKPNILFSKRRVFIFICNIYNNLVSSRSKIGF